MRVAVIGTGIAGNAAAWTLSKRYPVTVYDRDIRPGGHSHTVTIDYDGTPLAVDIGFIVYNELNYPDLTALFAHLGRRDGAHLFVENGVAQPLGLLDFVFGFRQPHFQRAGDGQYRPLLQAPFERSGFVDIDHGRFLFDA